MLSKLDQYLVGICPFMLQQKSREVLLTTSNTSAILARRSESIFFSRGTLLRKVMLSSSRCSPVLIMIFWKTRRSNIHTLHGVSAENQRIQYVGTQARSRRHQDCVSVRNYSKKVQVFLTMVFS